MRAITVFLDGPDVYNGVYYPSSDGEPMAETDFHVLAIRYLLDALDDVFAGRTDVFVTGNVNWFWAEGDSTKRRAPDAMVVFGVRRGPRRSFRSWLEGGAVPAVCFEMASEKTWKANLGEVKDDYEASGVKEYFVYDPTNEYLPKGKGPLMGFRRRGGKFQAIRPDKDGSMVSRQLGLRLTPEGLILRCSYADTGEVIPTREERIAAEKAKAEVEQARAEAETVRAEAERARAEALAAEVARLKAMLRASGKSTNGAH
jgi:Uma2 family endonuclease